MFHFISKFLFVLFILSRKKIDPNEENDIDWKPIDYKPNRKLSIYNPEIKTEMVERFDNTTISPENNITNNIVTTIMPNIIDKPNENEVFLDCLDEFIATNNLIDSGAFTNNLTLTLFIFNVTIVIIKCFFLINLK